MAFTVRPLHFASDPHRRLLNALESGDVEAARRAIDQGADPRVPLLSDGATSLHRLGGLAPLLDPDVVRALVRLLIQRGAQVDQMSGTPAMVDPHTPLMGSLHQRDRNAVFVDALLNAGADPNASSGGAWAERPLHIVLGVSHRCTEKVDLVRTLLDHGADVHLANHEGLTVLQARARDPVRGSDGMVAQMLLEHGADLYAITASTHFDLRGLSAMGMLERRERELHDKPDAQTEDEYPLAPVVRSWLEGQELRATLAAEPGIGNDLDTSPSVGRPRVRL